MDCEELQISQFKGKKVDIIVNKGDSWVDLKFEFFLADEITPRDISMNIYSFLITSDGITTQLEATINPNNTVNVSGGLNNFDVYTSIYSFKEKTPDQKISTLAYGGFIELNH